ncbi:MAG: hypothetical protein V7707_07525 [Motiliproteus sp.]
MDRAVSAFCTESKPARSLSWLRLLPMLLLCCLVSFFFRSALADDAPSVSRTDYSTLDLQVRTLKKEVLAINRELRLLEEEMLYPSAQQLVMLLSVLPQPDFKLAEISIMLDGVVLALHRYSDAENAALAKGGTHRPYMGRLKQGAHQLTVSISGRTAEGDTFQRAIRQPVDKQQTARYIELRVEPALFSDVPLLNIYQW